MQTKQYWTISGDKRNVTSLVEPHVDCSLTEALQLYIKVRNSQSGLVTQKIVV